MKQIVYIWLVLILTCVGCQACSPKVNEGKCDQDSTCLAKQYIGMKAIKWFCPDEYAYTCYYYGRLLRQRGSQSAAMQCFINGAHTDPKMPFSKRVGNKYRHMHSDSYKILGRIYTNMAVMCRLEGNHPLAYQMFEYSALKFKQSEDTTAYYYALNSMAFELAEQSNKEECLSLISLIESQCHNLVVLTKAIETKAEAFFMAQQYDSAIYYANLLQEKGNLEPTGFLIKAQSYSLLNQSDSAVYYASIVAKESSSLFDLNNSLYILANDNTSASLDEIQQAHANRADIQKLIEQRRAELAHAVELLQQDINEPFDSTELVIFVIAIFIIAATSTFAYIRICAKQKQVSENTHKELYIQTQLQAEQKRIIQQRIEFRQLQLQEIERLCEALRQSHNIKTELKWSDYIEMCEIINSHFNFFANKLKATHALNETEIRLCVLVLINLHFNQIAEILPYAPNSVGKLKDTTAKHLGTTGKQLRTQRCN